MFKAKINKLNGQFPVRKLLAYQRLVADPVTLTFRRAWSGRRKPKVRDFWTFNDLVVMIRDGQIYHHLAVNIDLKP